MGQPLFLFTKQKFKQVIELVNHKTLKNLKKARISYTIGPVLKTMESGENVRTKVHPR